MTPRRPFCRQSRAPRLPTTAAVVSVAAAAAFVLFSCLLGPLEAAVFLSIPSEESIVMFKEANANFGGVIPAAGMQGYLQRTIPRDACETVLNRVNPVSGPVKDFGTFALIERGNCHFDTKILNAQLAGYSGVIIYNNKNERKLITMSSVQTLEIVIPAVFMSLNSGQKMISLFEPCVLCYIQPNFDNTSSSTMPWLSNLPRLPTSPCSSSLPLSSSSSSYPVSFISLLAVSAILTTLMYLRRHRLRHTMAADLGRILGSGEGGERDAPLLSGMSPRAVKVLPEVAYSGAVEGCLGRETCAICLEDYVKSDRLRLLPCLHEFHVDCVDHWLTKRQPFCPTCKWDARNHQADTDEEAAKSSASSAPAAAREVSWTGSRASCFVAGFMRRASSLMSCLLRPSSYRMLRMSRLPISLMRSSTSALDTAREPFLR